MEPSRNRFFHPFLKSSLSLALREDYQKQIVHLPDDREMQAAHIDRAAVSNGSDDFATCRRQSFTAVSESRTRS